MVDNKVKMIIERKTWKDLASSIKDGRIQSQAENMIKEREQNNSSLLIIIEGNHPSFIKENEILFRINTNSILGKLRKLLIRDNIPHIRTRDLVDTCSWVINLAKEYAEIISGGEEKLQIPNAFLKVERNDYLIRLSLWTSFKGIGNITATPLVEKFSIGDVILGKVAKEDISKFEYSSGKCIGKKSEIFFSLDKETEKKILGKIPGIGKKKLEVLDEHTLKDLLNLPREELASLHFKNITLGKKVAENIYHFFQLC